MVAKSLADVAQVYTSTQTTDLMAIERSGVPGSVEVGVLFAADIGFVAAYAGSTPPSGWLSCDGSAISRATYAGLFTAIGTTWGVGDGSTTFNIPDLRERYPRGAGATNAVGAYLSGQNKAHTHSIDPPNTSTTTGGSHTHTYDNNGATAAAQVTGASVVVASSTASSQATSSAGSHSHTVNIAAFTSGSEGGTEARPDTSVVTYCIRF